MKLEMILNGRPVCVEVGPTDRLSEVLRTLGNKGVKEGCLEGTCGACTVLMDGKAVHSCMTLAGQAHGRRIETIEGVGTVDRPHPLQKALVDQHAVQCGFCTPGMILSAKALLAENPDPTDDEIKRALDGNLCRCTGYEKIIRGIRQAAQELRGAEQ